MLLVAISVGVARAAAKGELAIGAEFAEVGLQRRSVARHGGRGGAQVGTVAGDVPHRIFARAVAPDDLVPIPYLFRRDRRPAPNWPAVTTLPL